MLESVFEKLKNKIPEENLMYDETKDQLVFRKENYEVLINNLKGAIKLTVLFGGKIYEYYLRSRDEACAVIMDFHKGRIKIEQKDQKNILATGLLGDRYRIHSTILKVILWVVGLAIMASTFVMITAGILTLKGRHFDFKMDDIALFIMLFCLAYCGLSLIFYSFGRIIYESMLFSGVFILGLGICLVLFEVGDLLEGKTEPAGLAASVILYMIFIIPGVLLIRCSYFKKNKTDIEIKRTLILPTKDELSKIKDILYKDKKVLALQIEPTYDTPHVSGSRTGGRPYSENPTSLAYSHNSEFVLQINLSDIKVKSALPESGLLQFYVDDMEVDDEAIDIEYYPDVNEIEDDQESLIDSRTISIVPVELPDLWNITVDDFYYAASMAGVLVSDDLDLEDIINDQCISLETEDYLLGPCRLSPGSIMGNGEKKADQPLLSLGTYTEISCPVGGGYLSNIQVFINKENLNQREFSQVVTVEG